MKIIWLVLFTLFAEVLSGQITQEIPGVTLQSLSLHNDTNRAIVGLQVRYQYSNETIHVREDGLDTPFEAIKSGSVYLLDPPKGNANLVQVSVDWILLNDGSFYGVQKDMDRLLHKSLVRRAFFKQLMTVLDREKFVSELESCAVSAECMAKDKSRSSQDWYELRLVVHTYRVNASFHLNPKEFENVLSRYFMAHIRFPSLRMASEVKVKPDSFSDGWVFSTGGGLDDFRGTCNDQAPPTQTGSVFNTSLLTPGAPTYLTATYPTSFNGTGGNCKYSTFNGPGRPTYGFGGTVLDVGGDSFTTGAFTASAEVGCENTITNGFTPLNPSFQGGLYLSGNLIMYPRYRAETFISSNFSSSWPGDEIVFSVAFGLLESRGPHSNDDRGSTYNYLVFEPPWSIYSNNALTGIPNPYGFPNPTGASGNTLVLLTNANTNIAQYANGFGFLLANYTKTITCANGMNDFLIGKAVDNTANVYDGSSVVMIDEPGTPSKIPTQSVTPLVWNPGPVSLIYKHYPPRAVNNCDIESSYCCCYASGIDPTICTIIAAGASDMPYANTICMTNPAATAYISSLGMTPQVSSDQSGAVGVLGDNTQRIGVFRSSQAFLLDSNGNLGYDTGDKYFPNFYSAYVSPLYNPNPSDIPISGDWTGDGHAKVGIYRASTGQWFLDWNGDGVYDAGDVHYSFGGLPGDIPVVGNWAGIGSSTQQCVGVYRSGLWVLDANCNGTWDTIYAGDAQFGFGGVVGDIPVVGKWAGGLNDQVGVVRCYVPPGGTACSGPNYFWVLDWGWPGSSQQISHGVGQGPGCPYGPASFICLTPAPFAYGGVTGDKYLAGDWTGNRVSRATIYRSGTWLLDIDGSHQYNVIAQYGGLSGDIPVVGKW